MSEKLLPILKTMSQAESLNDPAQRADSVYSRTRWLNQLLYLHKPGRTLQDETKMPNLASKDWKEWTACQRELCHWTATHRKCLRALRKRVVIHNLPEVKAKIDEAERRHAVKEAKALDTGLDFHYPQFDPASPSALSQITALWNRSWGGENHMMPVHEHRVERKEDIYAYFGKRKLGAS